MTGRDEFVRQHPQLAAELDRIGQRAVLGAAWRDVRAAGRVDPGFVFGGAPFVAVFGLVIAGMLTWSWTLWLILPATLLGMGVPAWVIEALTWLVQFTARLVARSTWLRGSTGGQDGQGGDRR